MINKKQKKYTVLMGLLSLLLSACSNDNSDLIKFINNTKMRQGKQIEPIPQFASLPVFKFPENDNRRRSIQTP